MTPLRIRRKLIEVALPLDAINKESLRRKQKAPKGWPTSFHKWWAQRPLAAARAVIFAQMVDDPSEYLDVLLSDTKKRRAAEREFQKLIAGRAAKLVLADDDTIPEPQLTLEEVAAEQERDRLFAIIKDLVLWENTTNEGCSIGHEPRSGRVGDGRASKAPPICAIGSCSTNRNSQHFVIRSLAVGPFHFQLNGLVSNPMPAT